MCFSPYQVMGVPKVTGDILSYQFGQPHSLTLPAKERGEPGNEAIFWAHFHSLAPWQLYVYKHAQVLIGQLLEQGNFLCQVFKHVMWYTACISPWYYSIKLGSFPGLPTVQLLIACIVQNYCKGSKMDGGKAWERSWPSNSIIGCSTEPAIRPYTLCSCMNIVSCTLSGSSVIEHGDVLICGRISASCVDHEQCNVVWSHNREIYMQFLMIFTCVYKSKRGAFCNMPWLRSKVDRSDNVCSPSQ